MYSTSRALALVMAAGIAAASPVLVSGVAAASPPGNNGTVKIDAQPFATAPDNEPHVGCRFQVDFYGYDAGNLNATVTFTAQPPTGRGEVLLTDTVFIGQDAAGGGTDLDAQRAYQLGRALRGFTPHPKQGYHVKLTVNAEGSQGADVKHKVFWVQRCDSYGDTGGGSTGGGSTGGGYTGAT